MAVIELTNTTEKRVKQLIATGDLPADARVTKSFKNDEGQRVVRVASKEFAGEAPAPPPAAPSAPVPPRIPAPAITAATGVSVSAPVVLNPAESVK